MAVPRTSSETRGIRDGASTGLAKGARGGLARTFVDDPASLADAALDAPGVAGLHPGGHPDPVLDLLPDVPGERRAVLRAVALGDLDEDGELVQPVGPGQH